MLSME
jgi:hypothetical protein